MEITEIFLYFLLSFLSFPIIGMLGTIVIMTSAKLWEYFDSNYNEWTQKYGEAKTLYAINYLLGLIFFLVYFLFSYANTNA